MLYNHKNGIKPRPSKAFVFYCSTISKVQASTLRKYRLFGIGAEADIGTKLWNGKLATPRVEE